ncbi:Beta-catenin-like protein 1 [Yarrowia sp. B02]|nr:Beta-catenin-like protein 1 [Yarrowia sp. B02]
MASIDSVFENAGFDGAKRRKTEGDEQPEEESSPKSPQVEDEHIVERFAIQRFVDEHKDGPVEADWLKGLVLDLERAITANTEKRELFANEPLKFMDSEVDLEKAIRALSVLATTDDDDFEVMYKRFVSDFETHVSLMQLLGHPNLDIALITCEIFHELISRTNDFADPDALTRALWANDDFIDYIIELTDKIVQIDPTQIQYILDMGDVMFIEDDITPQLRTHIFPKFLDLLADKKSPLLLHDRSTMADFCLTWLTKYEYRTGVSAERIEGLIGFLMAYVDKDPTKGDEEGLAGSIAGILAYILTSPSGRAAFAEVEGMDAMVKLLGGEGKWIKKQAARIIKAALNSYDSTELATVFVQAKGLGVLFKALKAGKNKHYKTHSEYGESLWAVYASLLRLLPSDSPERVRVIAKMDKAKLDELKELRDETQQAVETMLPALESVQANREDVEEIVADMEMLGSRLVVVLDTIFAWMKVEGRDVEVDTEVLQQERDEKARYLDWDDESNEYQEMMKNNKDMVGMLDYLLEKR